LSDVRRFETAADAASSEPFDVHALRRLLRQGAYFVAPLRKRRAAMLPSSARITLGRAYDNDVV